MNTSIRSFLTAGVLALAGAGAAGTASAHEYTDMREYGPVPSQQWRYAYGQERYIRDECAAPRWDPNERYMPGDTVRRHGQLYMARGISARVWNVNSPPEWTPNYWVPARCG